MITSLVFYLLAGMIIIPALLVVMLKSVFHSALWLIVSLLGVGGMYAYLAADFLFAIQLLLYAGGIMVVLLFVVLLSGQPSDWAVGQVNEKAVGAGLLTALLVVLICIVLSRWTVASHVTEAWVTTGRLGQLLMRQMILPFEVISLVLVASLVGAIYFSSRRRP
ncbi:MAG: NADH-quinone oxidoreductase subunit J [Elusimicrobia bacterium]|nr:NADH-quinone oxidoreductase subunit J [Candidatus Obscuribacterium magneticum]